MNTAAIQIFTLTFLSTSILVSCYGPQGYVGPQGNMPPPGYSAPYGYNPPPGRVYVRAPGIGYRSGTMLAPRANGFHPPVRRTPPPGSSVQPVASSSRSKARPSSSSQAAPSNEKGYKLLEWFMRGDGYGPSSTRGFNDGGEW